VAKKKRKRASDPEGGDALPDDDEPAPAPLSEWLFAAGALVAVTYAAMSEGDDRAILFSLGAAGLFAAALWNSRKKRLGPPRQVRPPER
jgi:hypothetical protein